ncbi:hypothetical protein BDD43_2166 [Mucilaginibacter gracilis]|uniref:Nal1 C-terminal domain-containing protein n=1 Tax=Mucilaginibacter gracilis TaxID=423350 RepID=A0A495IZU2_9SPHI|nr:hypothetical protein [Mucilaginibacter gracilis]RKR82002.1 hypothetical protein BDD43_2166 [Mucilaginibacter gracilis]
MSTFDPSEYNFAELSLKDLADAREDFHLHLMKKKNVVATALGYYRIRKAEKWPTAENPHPDNSGFKSTARTLENSEIRPYSWPAILVFVDTWENPQALISDSSAIIPKTYYLKNGKAVPICVIESKKQDRVTSDVDIDGLHFPTNIISGGFPLMTEVQGRDHIASFGCLVTDGHYTYALTNRHVTGDPGSEITTFLDGKETVVGEASELQIGRVLFNEIYPDFPAQKTYLNMDIGLMRVNDVNQWKAEILEIGEMGRLIDINNDNISLKLVGQPVIGYGAVSGKKIIGELQALFYRYKSVGGFDYVSDFLIGPAAGQPVGELNVHHGDSGTLLLVDCPEGGEPLGILWGMHEFIENAGKKVQPYILGTFLSNVCNYLDVEIVRDWNLGQVNTWGSVGHFKIGAYACELVKANTKCSTFLMANQKNIGYTDLDMTGGKMVPGKVPHGTFVPLADVPDIIWRNDPRRKADESNHFADMDEHNPAVMNDQSLLKLNEDLNFITIEQWLAFDKEMDIADPVYKTEKDGTKTLRPRRGALPFRIWQCYNQMIKSLKAGNLKEYLVAGGIMSHYAGDACQPLHISYLHHGETVKEMGVHSDYETGLIAAKMADLFPMIHALGQEVNDAELIGPHGKDAAVHIISLMRNTIAAFPPMEVLESWRNAKGRGKTEKMWAELNDKTAATMATGAHALAILWQSAWKHGNGDALPTEALIELKQADLIKLYSDLTFIPSYTLDDVEAYKAVCW